MMKKLFRYDVKALKRVLLPFILAGLGCGALLFLCFAALRFPPANEVLATLSATIFGMLMVFLIIACICLPVAAMFFILHRYYKNFFTDEGYLTFVLPATMEEHVHAKILSGAFFSLLSTLAAIAALGIGLLLPNLLFNESNGILQMVVSLLFEELSSDIPAPLFIVVLAITVLVSLFSQLILFYTVITMGSLFMGKHKILGSILFYFVANALINVVSSVFATIVVALSAMTGSTGFVLLTSLICSVVMNIAIAVIGYFLILRLLKRRLNLE